MLLSSNKSYLSYQYPVTCVVLLVFNCVTSKIKKKSSIERIIDECGTNEIFSRFLVP